MTPGCRAKTQIRSACRANKSWLFPLSQSPAFRAPCPHTGRRTEMIENTAPATARLHRLRRGPRAPFSPAGPSAARAHVTAYDRKTDSAQTAAAMRRGLCRPRRDRGRTRARAVATADTVFCTVTADQARVAAEEAAPAPPPPETLWFDCNSCAPGHQARRRLDHRRGRGALCRRGRHGPRPPEAPPRPPPSLRPPGRGRAPRALQRSTCARPSSGPEIGQASSIKMLRSVMIKGLEAMTAECFLAARRAGVADQVIASLEASDPPRSTGAAAGA